jgi:hypothetical protein
MPATGRPSISSAISVPQALRPATKLPVPSIGSSTQHREPDPLTPSSSPMMRSSGRCSASSSRRSRSISLSVADTGDPSGLISTSRSSLRHARIDSRSARSAARSRMS